MNVAIVETQEAKAERAQREAEAAEAREWQQGKLCPACGSERVMFRTRIPVFCARRAGGMIFVTAQCVDCHHLEEV